MDDQRRRNIRARCNAATRGPWCSRPTSLTDVNSAEHVRNWRVGGHMGQRVFVADIASHEDLLFVECSRTDLPDALDYIDLLLKELETAGIEPPELPDRLDAVQKGYKQRDIERMFEAINTGKWRPPEHLLNSANIEFLEALNGARCLSSEVDEFLRWEAKNKDF